MASPSETSTAGNTNRFSNLTLSSVSTLVPEYTPANPSTLTTRFSNASLFSVRTLLPQYNAVDTEPIPDYCEDAHEFRYAFPIRPKNPWVTLHIHTRDSVPGESKPLQSQPRVPRLWSCDPLRGTVELDLDSPQNIQQITITLKGNIIVSSHEGGSVKFLNREFTVWDKSMSNPSQSNNADSGSNITQKQKMDTRLAPGQYTFPFSFPFRAHADPTSDNGPKSTGQSARTWTHGFSAPNESSSSSASERPRLGTLGSDPGCSFAPPLPQTFMEKGIDPNVAYSMSLHIVHGRFNTSSKIKTKVIYFSTSEPPPTPQIRRAAYEAGALIPCPMNDPEGWFALPTVTIPGVIKTDHGSVLPTGSVDCTLYIAQPLSYTRGSVIPCFIKIHSDGVKIARLLPDTEKPTVRLLRRLWHPLADLEQSGPGKSTCESSWAHVTVPTSGVTLVMHEVGRANWWMPSKEVVQGPNTRHFEGEIHLSPELKPSCDFQLFRTEYVVQLLSFQTANFTPEVHPSSKPRNGLDNVIASNIVEITTIYRKDEPVPTAYSGVPETYLNRHISTEKAPVLD